jgi:hypothetical protein
MHTPIGKGEAVAAWILHPGYRTPPVPTAGVAPGPWRHPGGGQIMNGAYERRHSERQVEIVTVWYGHPLRVVAGTAEIRFARAPLSVRGLTLGCPPCETAARIAVEAQS